MAHDVFISYANEDKTIACAVCANLEERSISLLDRPTRRIAGRLLCSSDYQRDQRKPRNGAYFLVQC